MKIAVLWDDSHFWGLMVLHALKFFGVPFHLLKAKEIAESFAQKKNILCDNNYAALIVPGGNAHNKSKKLTQNGQDAIREFVRNGGLYIGFCGGAGLALTGKESLNLCPWVRKNFSNRLQHFVSGYVKLKVQDTHPFIPTCIPLNASQEMSAPVWWPAQFQESENATVLARYTNIAEECWLADIKLSFFSKSMLETWKKEYKLDLQTNFFHDAPAIITGTFGQGQYFLSYPHLETPESPHANNWFAHILSSIKGLENICQNTSTNITKWDIQNLPHNWDEPFLNDAKKAVEALIRTGERNFLLFWRNSWLLGWRRGIPGSSINALYSLIAECQHAKPNKEATLFWDKEKQYFQSLLEKLETLTTQYFLAERLIMSFSSNDAQELPLEHIRKEKKNLFGESPWGGGLIAELLQILEDLYYLLAKNDPDKNQETFLPKKIDLCLSSQFSDKLK